MEYSSPSPASRASSRIVAAALVAARLLARWQVKVEGQESDAKNRGNELGQVLCCQQNCQKTNSKRTQKTCWKRAANVWICEIEVRNRTMRPTQVTQPIVVQERVVKCPCALQLNTNSACRLGGLCLGAGGGAAALIPDARCQKLRWLRNALYSQAIPTRRLLDASLAD